MPRIAHFIAYTGTAMGGPVNGMAAYTRLLADHDYALTVFSLLNGADGESVRLDPRVTLVQERGARAGGFRRSRALWRQAAAADVELVHSHGLWTDVNRLAGDVTRRRGLPHLLAPCGMLAPAALHHHWWKKLPARFWFQDRALREAHCLHAKSHKEYVDIRRFGLRNPVAIIANPIFPPPWEAVQGPLAHATFGMGEGRGEGRLTVPMTRPLAHATSGVGEGWGEGRLTVPISRPLAHATSGMGEGRGEGRLTVPTSRPLAHATSGMGEGWGEGRLTVPTSGYAQEVNSAADANLPRPLLGKEGFKEAFRQAYNIPGDKKIALFLGRLHRTKGPARLVQAWSAVREHHSKWLLVLAGPDEGGYRREVEALVAELGCKDSVIFTGELDDVAKWGALAAADLFVMPSDFENFGNAIVEAMLCELPVITTTGTPWKELPELGAGWWVEPEAEAMAGALREALALSDEERRAMGRKALQLAEEFRPDRAVNDLRQVYRWLLAGGERPTCVRD